jgi:hypothetical protein
MRTGENFTARSRGYSPSRFAGPVWRQAQAKSAYHDDNIVRVDSSNCSNVPPHYDPTGSLLRSTRQDGLQRLRRLGGVGPRPEDQPTEPQGLLLRVRRSTQAHGSWRTIRLIACWHLVDGSAVTPEQPLGIGAEHARLTDSGPLRGPRGGL